MRLKNNKAYSYLRGTRNEHVILHISISSNGVIRLVNSMTGYGTTTVQAEHATVTVEIRSVNSRYLDIAPKIPHHINHLEIALKEKIQSFFHRGRIELFITFSADSIIEKKLHVDWPLMDAYIENLQKAKQTYKLTGDISIAQLAAMEHVFTVEEQEKQLDDLESIIFEAVSTTCEQVKQNRQREGTHLIKDVNERINLLQNMLTLIDERQVDQHDHYKKRIERRIEQHIEENSLIDHSYVMQEIALLAERGDITEELTRLFSHVSHFESVVTSEGPIGRKLDFITQEMLREVNTIGSKSIDVKISEIVVSMKSEIEKVKEQIQNIE